METSTIVSLVAICIGASFVQRVSGFGFGIFAMSMLAYIAPSYGEATALSGLLASVTSAIIVLKTWRSIDWKRLWLILLSFALFSFFAVRSISLIDAHTIKHLLGAILVGVSCYFLFIKNRIKLRPSATTQVSMGGLSGLMGGFCGMQGPPAVLYFITACPSKEKYIAISQAYFLIGNMIMTVYRAQNNFLTPFVATAWCYGAIGVIAGTTIGSIVFKRISAKTLSTIVYIYIGISGIVALLS